MPLRRYHRAGNGGALVHDMISFDKDLMREAAIPLNRKSK